ncbi:PREDICTED: probable tubulin polyglutamylase TTLL2 [Elephantulus edwardii]|uniref:probable tubulin polyglutamylase TTLL2 n=1 Tax=Elephantulus edwardii TaxID=28737 RepID=UPI0003F09194|nr:PREDICTED: probable tubulin polyglutamylase TTLL2 [Elephantulus edwardii]
MALKRRACSQAEDVHPPAGRALVFRADDTTPEVVQSVLLERGWTEFDKQTQSAEDWHLYWRTTSFSSAEHSSLKPWQRLNHHPGTARLTRKDELAKLLRFMRTVYGAALYEFTPLTFIMPADYRKFMAQYCKERPAPGSARGYWICKPAELSRGRGIVVFSDIKDLVFHETCVVQRYICNPLLVGRYKCDLRIYVCVLAFRPLTIYLYQEGLVRFATEKFDLGNLHNEFAHLTNSSINRRGASCEKVKEVVGRGCKWTLSRFFSYLRSCDVDDLLLWRRISRVVILTVLAIAPSVPRVANCFELFGFDVLIDEKLKPWLLEVNYSPALSLCCPTDVSVKRALLHDIVDLIQPPGPRPSGKGGGRRPRSSTHVSPAKSEASGLCRVRSAQPEKCLLWVTSRALSTPEPAAQKAEKAGWRSTQASPAKERKSKQDAAPGARDLPKIKPKLRGRSFVPHTARIQSLTCQAGSVQDALLNGGEKPRPQAGNFVLIFPFNDATFRASRNGLDMKRIVQELQKLASTQHNHKTWAQPRTRPVVLPTARCAPYSLLCSPQPAELPTACRAPYRLSFSLQTVIPSTACRAPHSLPCSL